ncbi:hypothetical protein SAMN05216553_102114 [Lentzea fradiae]|uniref:Uncharacterized protein n=1 Tax=Lentzea fradiae TaxID=200378 RepID=A0A1G7M5K9_9PSEU|nr:hypothetical protein [Lentzea fradiae]SDF57048.1 hypothetical protein SAMN05216553_102114 [Lentzea fradiae]
MVDPFNRALCMTADAEGYGRRSDPEKAVVQEQLSEVLGRAAEQAGLARDTWQRQPKGDEELAVIPSAEFEPAVVDPFIAALDRELSVVNLGVPPSRRLRLRVALHHGVVHPAALGFGGQGVVHVCRLVNGAAVKQALTAAPDSNLAVVLSPEVFDHVVRQGHTSLSPKDFREIDVTNKEITAKGWLRVPGSDVHALDLGQPRAAKPAPAGRVAHIEFHDVVNAEHATFGFREG